MTYFHNIYQNKTVLITGHSGFKGSWLTLWLLALGANVIGYSKDIPTEPSHFNAAQLASKITHIQGDITDLDHLKTTVQTVRPDIVFHLAAQPLVRSSYQSPLETLNTNIIGTANILECIRYMPSIRSAVIITSDKCYRNVEWTWGYREIDELGGLDPYSASKGCAELIFRSYTASFFQNSPTHLATVRAGNVIGGGDWAMDRIVPDCVRAWATQQEVILRNPHATRPWQHVLEPLSGYLWLGALLYESNQFHGESFNLGPDIKINQSVEELISQFAQYWPQAKWRCEPDSTQKESGLLKLSCDKALIDLGWHAVLSFQETVAFTANWYQTFYKETNQSIDTLSRQQIDAYCTLAKSQHLAWTIS